MPATPHLDRYVRLITDKPLQPPQIKQWFGCVSEHAGPGVTLSVALLDDQAARHGVRLIHQTLSDGHGYLIPLCRDLVASEIEQIVHAYAAAEAKLDFDVDTNQIALCVAEDDSIPLDVATHLALCTALAKQRHTDWVRERTDAGWRYGVTFDQTEKTAPLLRPWEQLPDQYRRPDLNLPQTLITGLNDQGYVVISRADLDQLLGRA